MTWIITNGPWGSVVRVSDTRLFTLGRDLRAGRPASEWTTLQPIFWRDGDFTITPAEAERMASVLYGAARQAVPGSGRELLERLATSAETASWNRVSWTWTHS